MTKDSTQTDDLEMDEVLRHLRVFGRAPSREYIATLRSIGRQSAAKDLGGINPLSASVIPY